MNHWAERQQAFREALESRIVVLDGAMGTMLQRADLGAADFGGNELEGCNENLVRTRPDVVLDVHRAYFAAGEDMVETDSFGGTPLVLAEYGLQDDAAWLNRRAAELARQAAGEFGKPGRPCFVAGSMGPTTKSITVTGGVTFEQLKWNYGIQARGLIEGGADVLLVETCQDTRNVKAALLAIDDLARALGRPIPVMVSGTIEAIGTMLAGQTAEAFYVSIEHANLLSVGLNCATGPEFMTDHIRSLHQMATTRISCYPNAGLPDEEGKYLETPDSLAAQLEKFADHGWLNIVGGCCGTTPEHIRVIAQMVEGKRPRTVPRGELRSYYSGIELVEAEDSNRPLLVGERTNVIGSRLFKQLIADGKWDEASEIGRRQVRNGAHIVDVCLQSSDREELNDIPPFYDRLIRKIKAPMMIDTTDSKAVELALTYSQGKAIINSINLEDGEEKFERICPLARSYGAALVVGTIDEDPLQAQAFTRERKLQVAQRSVELLTNKYGIPITDILIDTLVFPCATGDENYIGGTVETIEAIRTIKEALPGVKTILGVSNVSFGLPAAAREVINSVFLYYATKAGLDLAIVNTEKLERFASISLEQRRLAENLLFNTTPAEIAADHPQRELLLGAPEDWREQSKAERAAVNQFNIAAVAEHFRQNVKKAKPPKESVPLDQRLANYIIEGTKDGLIDDLERKRAEGVEPLDIINGPLMAGMSEVGRLFNNNELIVAEVLQSAEAMKAAVNHLEQFMEKADTAARGKVILATVKGDVHDIGKNLVEIILANNGYEVVNLGIKVPPDVLIQACLEHRPDAIGLSGLLVKSTQQMVITASDLKAAGIVAPILVGGAALSEKFTRTKIAPAYGEAVCYAKDAMTGLSLMNRLMDPAERAATLASHTFTDAPAVVEAAVEPLGLMTTRRSRKVRTDLPIPSAPYLDRRVRDVPNLAEVWSYINPFMIYGRHLGYKGNFEKALAEHEGNAIHLSPRAGVVPIHTFHFGRQRREDGLCLSDYILEGDDGTRDHLALMVVTAGAGIRGKREGIKNAGA